MPIKSYSEKINWLANEIVATPVDMDVSYGNAYADYLRQVSTILQKASADIVDIERQFSTQNN